MRNLGLTQLIRGDWLIISNLIVSVIPRLGAVIYLGNAVIELPGTYDQISYHNLALRVSDGYGFNFGEGWWPMTHASTTWS